MGYEGQRRKPPEFIIKAAMQEDPSVLRSIQSRGGKAAAAKKAELKQIAAEREAEALRQAEAERLRLEEEREILDREEQRILRKGAFALGKAIQPPEET